MDILHCQPDDPSRRWVICYSDGSTRKSSHRYDLIRDESDTALTTEALAAWPDWEGQVVESNHPAMLCFVPTEPSERTLP